MLQGFISLVCIINFSNLYFLLSYAYLKSTISLQEYQSVFNTYTERTAAYLVSLLEYNKTTDTDVTVTIVPDCTLTEEENHTSEQKELHLDPFIW